MITIAISLAIAMLGFGIFALAENTKNTKFMELGKAMLWVGLFWTVALLNSPKVIAAFTP